MNSNSQGSETSQWIRLAQTLYATRDDELTCDQAANQMAQRFSSKLSEAQARQAYPHLFFHFQFCSDCAREYNLLLELTEMETTGQLVQPSQIPPRPGKAPSVQRIRDAIEHFFAGFGLPSSQAVPNRVRGARLGIEPVTTSLDSQLSLTIDVDRSESDTTLRSMMCTLEQSTDGEATTDMLEGTTLRLEDANGQIRDEALDAFGSAFFDLLAPGRYHLHLKVSSQEYILRDIDIP